MKKSYFCLPKSSDAFFLGLLLISCGTAQKVSANERLAKELRCMACHQVTQKRIGPAFKTIAQKYQGKTEMRDHLARRIKSGSQGVWGAVPMPANTHVSDQQAKEMADWILALSVNR